MSTEPSTPSSKRRTQQWRLLGAALLLCGLALGWLIGAPTGSASAQSTVPPPPWLEPRGVNIVDLVGVVPEAHLQDAILTYATGLGMLQYEWGVRQGDQVTIRARVTPNYGLLNDGSYYTIMGCLAQPAYFDQWPSTTAASTMRLFRGSEEITSLIYYLAYAPAGLVLPHEGVNDARLRYPRTEGGFLTPGPDGLAIPGNNNCFIAISGEQHDLHAEFRITAPQKLTAQFILMRECVAHSYIGYLDPVSESPLEATGVLAPLAREMALRFGDRHDKCPLEAPENAEFLLVKFPPTPLDPYAPDRNLLEQDPNFNLPGSGTYRLEARFGGLSVDHVSMTGQPLRGQWKDADQSDGEVFLDHLPDLVHLSAPEYFIPPGFSWNGSHFDPCMVRGGCDVALLDALHDATYKYQIYYYRFDRTAQADLLRVPLQQVGVAWQPAISAEGAPARQAAAQESAPVDIQQGSLTIYMPVVGANSSFGVSPPDPEPNPPDDASGCPCGWFDLDGRMYDYIAKPS